MNRINRALADLLALVDAGEDYADSHACVVEAHGLTRGQAATLTEVFDSHIGVVAA